MKGSSCAVMGCGDLGRAGMFLAGRSAVFTLITPGEHNWRLTSCEVGTCAPMLLARVQAKKTRPAESANGVFLEIVATADLTRALLWSGDGEVGGTSSKPFLYPAGLHWRAGHKQYVIVQEKTSRAQRGRRCDSSRR